MVISPRAKRIYRIVLLGLTAYFLFLVLFWALLVEEV